MWMFLFVQYIDLFFFFRWIPDPFLTSIKDNVVSRRRNWNSGIDKKYSASTWTSTANFFQLFACTFQSSEFLNKNFTTAPSFLNRLRLHWSFFSQSSSPAHLVLGQLTFFSLFGDFSRHFFLFPSILSHLSIILRVFYFCFHSFIHIWCVFFVSFVFTCAVHVKKVYGKKRRRSVWHWRKNGTSAANLDAWRDFSPLPLHPECSRVPSWWRWRRSLAAGCVVPPCWAEGWGWWDFPPVRLGRRLILSRHFFLTDLAGCSWNEHILLIRHFHTKIFFVLFGYWEEKSN